MSSTLRTCIVVGQWEMIEKLHMWRMQERCGDDAGFSDTTEQRGNISFSPRRFERAVWCSLRNWGEQGSPSFGAGDVETGEWRRFWNVQRCSVDERLSGAAHVQFDSSREEQFVASERITFSVVFLKMDFVLVRSDWRAKASRSNLFYVVSVFVSWW